MRDAPQPVMQHPQPAGDRCAFPRNLTRGTYGGDVNCLQQHLAHQARGARNRTSGATASFAARAQRRVTWAPALRFDHACRAS